jgi:hypothetical protein
MQSQKKEKSIPTIFEITIQHIIVQKPMKYV